MHIVEKVDGIWSFIAKIGDIALGLFIGFLEIIGELVRMASLSLRLFWNIFAGMIVMGIIITIMQDLVHAPWLTPLIIFVFELMVSFIQAFVFSILFLVYNKIAAEGVH
jgi:F-type H+-transporting ATPase subunit a